MKYSVYAMAMASVFALPASAQAAPVAVQIAPQRLDSALVELARGSHTRILFTPDVVGVRTTGGASGTMEASAALGELLAGSGLTYTASDTGYVVLAAQTAAQAAPAAPAPDTPGSSNSQVLPDSAATEPQQATQDIVVTGSRTATNGNNQPTPVTVVTTAELTKTTPTNLADALNKLPIFMGSTSNTTTGNATTNASGNYLNLRGLGAIRTLILFNGQRVASTAANGTVDVDTLPEMLVKRVDVVTGGASAVYGSDAVTGVVNFVLDNKYDGLKTLVQGGITSRGDNGQYRLGIAAGHSFAGGRLHVEGSFEYFNENGIPSRQDRPTTSSQAGVGGAGTSTDPYQFFTNYLNSNESYGGEILSGPLKGQQFTSTGQLVPFVAGQATGTSGTQNGGDGTWQNNVTLAARLRTEKAFGRVDYDFGSAVQAYVQGNWSSSYNFTAQQYLAFNPVTISATDAFLTSAEQAAASAGGAKSFTFGRLFTDQSLATIQAYTSTYNITGGLNGPLWRDLKWNAYFSHSKSDQHVVYNGNNNNGREYASLDAVKNAAGQIVCSVTITNPGLYPGCIPLNPFADSATNAAAVAWIRGTTEYRLDNFMDDLAGNIAGRLFDDWAGPVTVALSGETRKLRLTNDSNALPTTALSCTGLRFNCTATSVLWGGNVTSDVDASERISEAAIETTVPLLADKPWAKSLEFNGAYRFAHYSTSGNASTWKLGGTWALDNQVTFRATRSRDFRAPTLYDLYQPLTQNQSTFSDILTGVSKTVPTLTFGNPNLKPEVSYTTTIGVVLTPKFIPRFSMSLDYYDINISNEIATITGASSATQQLCNASGGTSTVCALYVRPDGATNTAAGNFPTEVFNEPLNIATTQERGIDAEANYRLPLNQVAPVLNGQLTFRLMTTYQPVYKSRLFANQPLVNSAGTASVPPGSSVALALPKVRATVAVDYTDGPVALGTQVRWHSHMGRNSTPGVYFYGPEIPAYAVVDINASYDFHIGGAKMETFVTIQNLFDNLANAYASTAGVGPFVPGDDIYGTTFIAGIRMNI